jgi:hypothetical protein
VVLHHLLELLGALDTNTIPGKHSASPVIFQFFGSGKRPTYHCFGAPR